MPTVTVQQIVRQGAGYESIEAQFGVRPIEGSITKTSVTFPDPAEGLDLEAVAQWLVARDDDELAQRQAVAAARSAMGSLLAEVAAFNEIEAPDLEDHFNQIHVLSEFALAAAGAFGALASLVLGDTNETT